MRLAVALRLGRISNLPTVWTNVLTGVALAGASIHEPRLPLLLVALSLFYVGGMFLNDAFDRNFDARERPERPIPSGQASAHEVLGFGFGMLGLGLALLAHIGVAFDPVTGWHPVVAGAALAASIVFYNLRHKNNPLSPVVVGVCRMLVYFCAALAVALTLPKSVYLAAAVLLCYLIGLTYAAKQEHLGQLGSLWPLGFLVVPLAYGAALGFRSHGALIVLAAFAGWVVYALWLLRRRARGDVPRAVTSLIAGIALLDAVILAGHGAAMLAALAVLAFFLTLALQRWVPGT
jgi:4-hydroxybenzoate polyprenyltransferase